MRQPCSSTRAGVLRRSVPALKSRRRLPPVPLCNEFTRLDAKALRKGSSELGAAPKRKAKKLVSRKSATRKSKLDLKALGDVAKSPLKLKNWLDLNIPWLVGPQITSFEPGNGQRNSIITIHGSRFASARADNEVTVGGTPATVLAAGATELKVLVARDTEFRPSQGEGRHAYRYRPARFHRQRLRGGGRGRRRSAGARDGRRRRGCGRRQCDRNNPRFDRHLASEGSGAGKRQHGATGVDTRWKDVQKFYKQASYNRTDVQYDIAAGVANLDGIFTDFVDLNDPVNNIISTQQDQIAAICAQHAVDQGLNLNDYQMMCCVVFTNADSCAPGAVGI